ncbi:unnamed protein product [Peronospora belbahrii]|uniref:FLZ-type domain-containing protein n=1 Tax=Peronospora belbahrii TaxID=622444 RepID=A0AAU9KJU2_9STRA|nr:unnamed protein product [Peronospora belbahrii]CAH0516260.1 unnamed protein product [Peronospora belbahrii]
MTRAARILSNQSTSVRRQTNETKRNRAQKANTSSPSFASRMIQFIFKIGRRATEQRSQSWSGRPESDPVPVPTTACHQASANIAIPNGLSCSAPSAVQTSESSRVQQLPSQGAADGNYSKAQWRQLQTRCANCDRLFFTSLSSLSGAAGRFCSLDCKANLEYMYQIQEAMDAETWGSSVSTCEWRHEDDVNYMEESQCF